MGMRGKIVPYLGLLELKFIQFQMAHRSYEKHVIFKMLLFHTKTKNSAPKCTAPMMLYNK